jgi:hypothetical protein
MLSWHRYQNVANVVALLPRLTLLEDAYRVLTVRLGDGDRDVLYMRMIYSKVLLALGSVDRAREVFCSIISVAADAFCANHSETFGPSCKLAFLHLQQQHAQEAIEVLLQKKPAVEVLGTDDKVKVYIDLLLGQAYIVQEEQSDVVRAKRSGTPDTSGCAAAVPHLQRALEYFTDSHGQTDYWTVTAKIRADKCKSVVVAEVESQAAASQ